MKPVGLIANPDSGRDIRRLVAYGDVCDSRDKINILKRVLLGLDALGVEEVLVMPDPRRLGITALDGLDLRLHARLLDMEPRCDWRDSARAAGQMASAGAACLVTLGGDGTNRVVAGACGDTPLLPISTGTNNVFPFMIEGTVAGMAAGVVAREAFPLSEVCAWAPRLEISYGENGRDMALVDLVVTDPGLVGARAVYDVRVIREIILCRAAPGHIGFSSVGAAVHPLAPDEEAGLRLILGEGGQLVRAPIAPGLLADLSLASWHVFHPPDMVQLPEGPLMLALDGEREVSLKRGESATVRLNPCGVRVVRAPKVLEMAARSGLFVMKNAAGGPAGPRADG